MTSYAVTSAAAGIYALGFLVLLAASVGDTRQQFNVQAWFSWQAVMLVVLVAERSRASQTARRWHALLRQALLAAAAAQAIGFIVWIAVEWSRAPPPPPDAPLNAAPDNVYAILIGALVVNLIVAAGTFFAVLRNDIAWWW
jgi:hypothetical protein